MFRFLIAWLLLGVATFVSFAQAPTKTVFNRITDAALLHDGMEFYLYTEPLPIDENDTREIHAGRVNNTNFQFRNLAGGLNTKFNLIEVDGVMFISSSSASGVNRVLAYDRTNQPALMQKVDLSTGRDDMIKDDRLRMNISFGNDGRVEICPSMYADNILDVHNNGDYNYSAYFQSASGEDIDPIFMGTEMVERLANAPVITVTEGWKVKITSPDNCEILYQTFPVNAAATSAARRVPLSDEWKEWNDENWNNDQSTMLEDHYLVAKCRQGELESDTVSAIVKSMILTGAQDVIDKADEPTVYDLYGRRVLSDALPKGSFYIRRSGSDCKVFKKD